MKQLTRLDLSVCREVTDAGVMHLSRLTTLSSLDLTFIDKVTQVGVASLSRYTIQVSLQLTHLPLCLYMMSGRKYLEGNSWRQLHAPVTPHTPPPHHFAASSPHIDIFNYPVWCYHLI